MMRITNWVLLLTMVLVSGCGDRKKEDKKGEGEQARIGQKTEKMEVKVQKVRLSPFEMELVSNGKVNACRKAVLTFVVNDVVKKVYVRNGERVRKGQPIVRVDEYKSAQQLKEAELNLEKARLELRSRLMSEGINEWADTAATDLLPRARFETIKLQSGYTVAENSYRKALYDYANIDVRAPFDGLVADLEAKEYNQSGAYKEVCSLIDDSQMELVFNVLETEIANLKSGMEVEITPYANSRITLKGKVIEVNPKIDENGMVKVKAVTTNQDGVLVDGMNVSILVKRQVGAKLIIPKSAVLPRQGKKVVFVHEQGKAIWKYVVTGVENSREVCIESGLEEGEEVIYENNLSLSHESEVTVIE